MSRGWKRPLGAIGAFLVSVAIAGVLFVWAGLVPIAASSGHWSATAWALHWAMGNSVRTRSLGVSVPPGLDLDDPALILRGAGHYESGCAPCHGQPGRQQPVIARQMTPEPPYLPTEMGDWEDRELFWITRHGVKYTAMPAWPALGREDEVWSMVAFLRRIGRLSVDEYDQLAGLADDEGPARIGSLGVTEAPVLERSCGRCHGEQGHGRGVGAFPILAGQNEAYLLASLRAYAEGTRHSGFMQPVAAGLTEDEMRQLAVHYAGAPAPEPQPAEDPAAVAFGERIARDGLADGGVPACSRCHGPKVTPRAAIYPELAGQYPAYLVDQLEAFRDGDRGGTPFAHVMEAVARTLTDEQIEAVAAYYGSLDPS